MCAYRLFRSVKRPFQSSGWKTKSVISILTLFPICYFLPLMRQYRILLCCDSFKECRWNCFVLFLHTLIVSYLLNHTGSTTVFHTPTSLFVVIDLVYCCCTHPVELIQNVFGPEVLGSFLGTSPTMHFWVKGNWNICLEAVCLCSSWSSNMQLVECNWNNGL